MMNKSYHMAEKIGPQGEASSNGRAFAVGPAVMFLTPMLSA